MANENEGHRERMRQRMMKEGLENFQDHEILEMLLYQYLPRRDTNKLAHRLLDEFGSLTGVLNAKPGSLIMVKGIGMNTACNLALLKEVWRRYKLGQAERKTLSGINSIVKYAEELMTESYVERFVAVYVDHSTQYMNRETYSSQSSTQVVLETKNIVATAIRIGAAGVMVFHCHVDGTCNPSSEDIEFTQKLMIALASVQVVLLEHIIFNNQKDYYSFFMNGDIAEMQKNFKNLQF